MVTFIDSYSWNCFCPVMKSVNAVSKVLLFYRNQSQFSQTGPKATIVTTLQGDHGDLRLDFGHLDSAVPPVCPFAVPSLPNFHLPKQ